jgi:DinB family protein
VTVVGRVEAIARLRDGQARLDKLLAGLSANDLTRPGTIGGGWSVKDLIGHIATWEQLALCSIHEFGSHDIPWAERPEGVLSAPATGKVAAFNARTLLENGALSLRKIRATARRTHEELLSAIESLDDRGWKAKAFYPTSNNRRRTLAALLGTILAAESGAFRHNLDHIPDLDVFVRSPRR